MNLNIRVGDPDLNEAIPVAFVILSKCIAQNVPREKAVQTLEELLIDLPTRIERLTDSQVKLTSELCREIVRDSYPSVEE